jgi:phosphate transport system permease protein
MTEGGIFPALVGTLCLTFGAIIFALPLGVFAAIYLTEYAKQGKVVRIIRLGINNLAGVPSVVFGLFGLAIFVEYLRFGPSILSGSLTLGILILPTIIRASEEALLAIPQTFREASLALGASKWHTIYKAVLPAAIHHLHRCMLLYPSSTPFHLRPGDGSSLSSICPGYRGNPF